MPQRLLIRNARALTLQGESAPRRGAQMSELGVLPRASVLIEEGRISQISDSELSAPPDTEVIEAAGRVLMPAFVDCHTHACWAGDRLDEWELKQRGATYLELLKAGGGIMSTVRAVRAATQSQLTDDLLARLNVMWAHGTICAEVKSGYGLTPDNELKMLRAIRDAGERWSGQVVPTACIGHALDPEINRDQFIQTTIYETLPMVTAEFPGIAIDAYCEEGAWGVDECLTLFDKAQAVGHPIRVHADQFHSLGLIPHAIERKYASVDHLEATTEPELKRLAESEAIGVMLPCSGFHVDGRYAAGRQFIDHGGALAIASNYNPGSAPCPSIPMTVALAVRHLGITAAEAIIATTVNAASLLNVPPTCIEPGGSASLLLLHHTDERQLGYEFGANPVSRVFPGSRLSP